MMSHEGRGVWGVLRSRKNAAEGYTADVALLLILLCETRTNLLM